MANVTRYGEISPVNGYLRGQGELHYGPLPRQNTTYDGDRDDDDDDVSLLTFPVIQLYPKLFPGTRYSMVSRD
jgi:hypothetical protein